MEKTFLELNTTKKYHIATEIYTWNILYVKQKPLVTNDQLTVNEFDEKIKNVSIFF